MKLFVPLLVSLSLSAGAQSVSFRGEVDDVQGTVNQFVVQCTNVSLSSTTLNLNLFEDGDFLIEGTWNGSFTNPAVVVNALTPVIEDFDFGGGAKLGDFANFEIRADAGDQVSVIGTTTGPGFFPLPSAGAVLVGLDGLELYASGTVPAGGFLQLNVPIPNNPALEGVTVYTQALLSTPTGFRLTQSDCKTLSS